ncbi:uncharacterized protein LOC110877971 isoform X1 [Helianthus annuus]|uniref:uncharacterized protein LOC110877971 isoform X1 n=2 Tax=Helianthus annuus TaxID=4232 RepID=UPI000B8FA002|nr:uncharacterized protein LOC110877971 isoform X1 [Helianthus annuus]XP_035833258.1 uncharacterized protein LOC110877971 isoform X1 [Helianthus annuus]XP_035833259.1 uncharacterized protein LOC110877971 isoform X1 [Helianthus annuus]
MYSRVEVMVTRMCTEVIVGATLIGDRRSCFSYFMNAKAIWWKLCTWLNVPGVASCHSVKDLCHSVKDLMLKLELQDLKKRKKAIRSNNHWRNSSVKWTPKLRDMPNEALEEEFRALMSDKYGETEYQESMQSQIDIIKVSKCIDKVAHNLQESRFGFSYVIKWKKATKI